MSTASRSANKKNKQSILVRSGGGTKFRSHFCHPAVLMRNRPGLPVGDPVWFFRRTCFLYLKVPTGTDVLQLYVLSRCKFSIGPPAARSEDRGKLYSPGGMYRTFIPCSIVLNLYLESDIYRYHSSSIRLCTIVHTPLGFRYLNVAVVHSSGTHLGTHSRSAY